MKYLPDRFKDSVQSKKGTASATRRVAKILDELLKPPKRWGTLKIQRYTNTQFVSLILEERFYEEFERNSLELGLPPEHSTLKALEDYNEKMKKAIAIKNKNKPSRERRK